VRGNPWSGYDGDFIPARKMVLTILTELEVNLGFRLHRAVGVNNEVVPLSFLTFQKGMENVSKGVEYVGLALNRTDRIAFLSAGTRDANTTSQIIDPALQSEIHAAIERVWPRGIQGHGAKGSGQKMCFEWKLRGNPWRIQRGCDSENGAALTLVSTLLSVMVSHGYEVLQGVSCSKSMADMSTIVFRRSPESAKLVEMPEHGPRPPVLGVSLEWLDQLRVCTTAREDLMPAVGAIQKALGHPNWPEPAYKHDRVCQGLNSCSMELLGHPFHEKGRTNEFVYTSALPTFMFDALYAEGWVLRTRLDMSCDCKRSSDDNPGHKLNVGAMFFTKRLESEEALAPWGAPPAYSG